MLNITTYTHISYNYIHLFIDTQIKLPITYNIHTTYILICIYTYPYTIHNYTNIYVIISVYAIFSFYPPIFYPFSRHFFSVIMFLVLNLEF